MIKNRHWFGVALERFNDIIKHVKNFEFTTEKDNYDYSHLDCDIKETIKALTYTQENYVVYDALYELIVKGIEIEDVYAKYGPERFNQDFRIGDYHKFKFYGEEIEVDGYEYLTILNWYIKQRRKIGEKDGEHTKHEL